MNIATISIKNDMCVNCGEAEPETMEILDKKTNIYHVVCAECFIANASAGVMYYNECVY